MDIRIISIGVLASNTLWGERPGVAVRTGHATTTLINAGKRRILIDPGLPEAVIAARLAERANLKPADITHVFLTSFNPETRRGLTAFEKATWWVSEAEREAVGVPMAQRLREAAEEGDDELRGYLETDVAILRRCEAAPDRLSDGVDLFPLPGVTPGLCGALVSLKRSNLLIAGDAVATADHLERGMLLPGAWDVERAQESFTEALEIADVLIPGRDNIILNPVRSGALGGAGKDGGTDDDE